MRAEPVSAKPRQVDITRAVKAAQACGIVISKIEIDKDGKISILSDKSSEAVLSPLDNFMKSPQGARLHAR